MPTAELLAGQTTNSFVLLAGGVWNIKQYVLSILGSWQILTAWQTWAMFSERIKINSLFHEKNKIKIMELNY